MLHADDHWFPETLSTILPHFENDSQIDFVYGNWKILKEGDADLAPGLQPFDDTLPGTAAFARQVGQNRWLPSASFVRRSLADAIGPPHPAFHMVVDVEYHLRAAAHSRLVRAVATPLVVYRIHDRSMSANSYRNGVLLRELIELPPVVARWASENPALVPHLERFACSAAETVYSLGVVAVLDGELETGRARMRSARSLCPGLARRHKVLVDRVLLRLGGPGRLLFRYFHRKSIRTPAA
jgi:hypothetical protein